MGAALSGALSADVALASANTYFDGPSVTVYPGRHLITGQVLVQDTAAGASFTAKLSDGTTDYASAEATTHAANEALPLSVSWIVTVTGTSPQVFKIRVASTGSAGLIKAATPDLGSGNHASVLNAFPTAGGAAAVAIGSDVSLSTNNTYFDVVSVTYPVTGTATHNVLITGHVTVLDTAGASKFTATLYDGSTALASVEEWSQGAGEVVHLPLRWNVAISAPATKTYKISVAASGSTTGVAKAATPHNSPGNLASVLAVARAADGRTDQLFGNPALTVQNSFNTTNGPGVALPAGLWLVTAQGTFRDTVAGAGFVARLANHTTSVFVASGEAQSQAANETVVIPLSCLVRATGSETIVFEYATTRASPSGQARFSPPDNDAGASSTSLAAVLVGPATYAFDIPMFAADCKVLALWNGSSNNAPPANWDTVGFNDSGWSSAVSPAVNLSNSYGAAEWGTTTTTWPDLPPGSGGADSPQPLPPGCETVSTTTATSGNSHAQYLIRWYFFIPDLAWDAIDTAYWTSGVDPGAPGGPHIIASNLSGKINGNTGFIPGNTAGGNAVDTYGVPGATNLIALEVNGFAPFPTNVGENWVAEMWGTVFIRYANSTGPVFPPATTPGRRAWVAVIG